MGKFEPGLKHPYYKKLDISLEDVNEMIRKRFPMQAMAYRYKSTPKTFIREFRRNHGLYPGEYMNLYKKKEGLTFAKRTGSRSKKTSE